MVVVVQLLGGPKVPGNDELVLQVNGSLEVKGTASPTPTFVSFSTTVHVVLTLGLTVFGRQLTL